MKRKIIISSLIVLILIGGIVFWRSRTNNTLKESQTSKVEIKELDKDEPPTNDDESITSESKNKEESNEVKKEKEVKQQNVATSNNQTSKQVSNSNTQKSKATNSSKQQNNQPVSNNNPTPAPKEVPIWEQLGMTQDRYENQPSSDWMRVDFKTMEECSNYGDNYKPYLDGKESWSCFDVTSLSGKYLGVMFETTKLIK